MPVGQQELPVIATTRDRATMLTILSGELAERLSKHPIPPRIIMPVPAPSHRRWLAWVGGPAVVGLAAATIIIALPHFRSTQPMERRAGSTGLPGGVAVIPISTSAVAATPAPLAAPAVSAAPAASETVTSIVDPPAIAAGDVQPQPPPVPAARPTNRELTWAEVHELQARLRALTFDPGPLDGVKGPLTSGGVRRFQESRGIPATGAVDLAVLSQVREASGTAD